MRLEKDYIVITDIGSTTTKALLLDNREDIPKLLGLTHAPTSVEAPQNDVRHGIRAAVEVLQGQSGIRLLQGPNDRLELDWEQNVAYFSTSSAGGGLQILVIGLTLFDSASSGKRCAYGAGGVILDTFAIDDKRQAMEQMLAMRNLHPDMILLAGGTDGGAVSGVLRMAEILRLANPAPKFDLAGRIPALYAGNIDAAPIIAKLIGKSFDLHILPNIRPSLDSENLRPTQDRIQELFMENVMEHAPGYAEVKPSVCAPIIPTPAGVQRALALIAGNEARNIFAFDIGGATTDVFSYINTHFQRTVSANLGMSYSAWNVLRESGLEKIKRWLPEDLSETELRNYIANKCLHPTSNPQTTIQFRIEHALAREALALALEQHRAMHYNTSKLGYLDQLKKGEIEKFELQFEYQREDQKHRFSQSDIDVLIGAGGIFAHAQNSLQCAVVLIDALQPKGITEIWIDRQFISPHLGVLSDSAPETSRSLLFSQCVEKLALHIAPSFPPKEKKVLMSLEVTTDQGKQNLEIKPDSFHFLPMGKKAVSIKLHGKCRLNTDLDLQNLTTELPVIIDTRLEVHTHREEVEKALQLYPEDALPASPGRASEPAPSLKTGNWTKEVVLPYSGDIDFEPGARVQPDDVVAVNRFNPPRLYIVNGFSHFREITPEQISASLKVNPGEAIDYDQNYATVPPEVETPHYNRSARHLISPVRGRIEYIDPNTGIMVVSEIQDYSGRPVEVNYAAKLMLKPKQSRRYLKVQQGDFVYQGEVLARRLEKTGEGAPPVLVKAPSTGTITEIDAENGTLTITYLHQPLEFHAHVHGTVTDIVPSQSLRISYESARLEGKIAFGRECHGRFLLFRSPEEIRTSDPSESIVALPFPPDREILKSLADKGARGLICHELDATELTAFMGFEPGVINTGNEALPLTVMVLSGFGNTPMPESLVLDLSSRQSCHLNPHTRIRAGVVRPFASF
ncbi:MAG: glutamate mutase L [Candidatus Syntrophosphaera sp.]|nr:glutamate mutase L [Candidatus Syntrophosphaera sp.]